MGTISRLKRPSYRATAADGFYAAQTFSTLGPSDKRQVQIGWLQAPRRECHSTSA